MHVPLDLNCVVVRDDFPRTSSIELDGTKTVSVLKELNKDKKKPAIPTDSLTNPPTENRTTTEKPVEEKRGEPGRDSINVLEQRSNDSLSGIVKALPPSDSAKSSAYESQAAYSIRDDRCKAGSPRATVALPVQLFHPAFGHFLDDIRKDDPIPIDIIRDTVAYVKEASAAYATENSRRVKLRPLLPDVPGDFIRHCDDMCPDSIVEFLTGIGPATTMPMEERNEERRRVSASSTQAGFPHLWSWAQVKIENLRNDAYCYSFIVATTGPWVVILGAIDMVIVQNLTDCVRVGIDSLLNEPQVMRVARMFYALRTSLERPGFHYGYLHPTTGPSRNHYFPSITSYLVGNKIVQFEYLDYLEKGPSRTAILRARTCTTPTQDIVVKFVERYGERAHKILEAEHLAPRLHYCGSPQLRKDQPSYCSVTMVVMDYVVGSTLAEEMKRKGALDTEVTRTVRQELQRAIHLLHTSNLVFGNLCPPSVLITRAKEIMLIDFDWAGVYGQATYPCLISPGISWSASVKALGQIEFYHDGDMLNRLL